MAPRLAAIAAAFLVPTATMAQRPVRTKRQLRAGGVRFELPPPERYAQPLPAASRRRPRPPRRAFALVTNPAERELLARRLSPRA